MLPLSTFLSLTAGSSSIKVKDERSGSVFRVGAHDLSSSYSLTSGSILISLLLPIAMLHSFIY